MCLHTKALDQTLIIVIFDKESLVCSLTLYTACLVLTFGCWSISLKPLKDYHTKWMLFNNDHDNDDPSSWSPSYLILLLLLCDRWYWHFSHFSPGWFLWQFWGFHLLLLKVQVFWAVTLCCWLNSSQHFKVPSSSVFSGPKRIAMSKSRVYHPGTVVKG